MKLDSAQSTCTAPADTDIKNILASKYEILEKIGRGGMATVYKAKRKNLNKTVALKVLHPEFARSEDVVRRFGEEALWGASLQQQNLIDIYDRGEEEGLYYIEMEYLEGVTIHERIGQSGPIAEEEVVAIVNEIAKGLDHFHARGFIHRDVKPSNIFLTNDDRYILMDFGIAKKDDSKDTRLTQPGAVLGTPQYMSPEQAGWEPESEKGDSGAGKPKAKVSSQSDIFSLGVVMYEMATGRLPFQAENPFATLHKVINEDPVKPCQIAPGLSSDLEKRILKCLEKNPADRFQTAIEIFEDYRPPQKEKPPGSPFRWALTGISAAIVVIGAWLLWEWLKEPYVPPDPALQFTNYTTQYLVEKVHTTDGIHLMNLNTPPDSLLGYLVYTGEVLGDFEYTVKAELEIQETNEPGYSYGIFFRRDSDCGKGYQFGIGGHGHHFCLGKHDGIEWIDLIDWTESTSIKEQGPNLLTVRAVEGNITLLINGQVQKATPFRDFSYRSGYLGVFCGPGQKVKFSDVNLTRL